MTIIIDAPAEVEAAIMQEAARVGLSVSEFTLRALLEKAAPQTQADRQPTREEVKARVRSGYYIVSSEVSSDGLIAERRAEARREAE